MFYNMVDTIVVGKYVSVLALASVGTTTPVVDLLLGLVIGFANGLFVIVAQKIGSKDQKTIKKV